MIADAVRKVELSASPNSYSPVVVADDDPLLLAPPQPSPATLTLEATREKRSYGQILKSSALIGGSQIANIAIGIVRTKAMAMLLGPPGFGLFGLYGSIANLTQSVAGMGQATRYGSRKPRRCFDERRPFLDCWARPC
jgi:hypothetical protein